MRDAYAAARRAGKRIGNPDLGGNNRQAAVERAERLRTYLAEMAQLPTQAAADELNRRGAFEAGGLFFRARRVWQKGSGAAALRHVRWRDTISAANRGASVTEMRAIHRKERRSRPDAAFCATTI